ncbi:MAG TPA: hypothetical protein V6D22_16970 [Candidatus Obscuribacterales bacterium]
MTTYGEIIRQIPEPGDLTERADETIKESAATVLESLVDHLDRRGCARAIMPAVVTDEVISLVLDPLRKRKWNVNIKDIENGARLLTIDARKPASKRS